VNYCRLKLTQERKASEQIVGHAFGAVWIVGVPPCSRPERGHVGEVAKVENRLRGVCLAEGEHCLRRARIGKVAVRA
jgi:hypothetical protein